MMRRKAESNSFKNAKSLGRLSSRLQVKDSLSESNSNDFFKVNLTKSRSFSASLNNIKTNVTLQIYNNRRGLVDQATLKKGGKGKGILRNLDRGLYYIQVSLGNGKRTPYQLQLSTSAPRPEPGNEPKDALNIGRLRGTYTDKRLLNDPDPNRFYRFSLNQITDLETTLTTASGFAQANLIFDANGNRKVDEGEIVRTTSSSTGVTTVETLPPGTYYLQVEPRFTSDRLQYDLKMVTTPNPGNLGKKRGGESLRKPQNIGTLDNQPSGTVVAKDYVGTLDSTDVLKFQVREISSIQMNISSNGITQAQLIFDANGNKQIDADDVLATATSSASFGATQTVTPGTYFVQVTPRFGASTRYDLSLVATPNPGNLPSDPAATLTNAFDAGTLNQLPGSTFIGKDYVGDQDSADTFRFQLTETRNVNMRINGSLVGASLIFDTNSNGLIDPGDVLTSTANGSTVGTTRTLAPGNYFVQVTPRFGGSSAYELILTTT